MNKHTEQISERKILKMYKFTLAENCPEIVLIQHFQNGDLDYTKNWHGDSDLESVWTFEKAHGGWVKGFVESGEGTLKQAEEQFFATLGYYTQEEILSKAECEVGWPLELGFVVKKEKF